MRRWDLGVYRLHVNSLPMQSARRSARCQLLGMSCHGRESRRRYVPILLQKSGGTGRSRPEGLSYIPGCRALPRERRLGRIGTDARDAYAAHTVGSGGGLATNLASRRRFWAMAASVNSSCAARGPRKRRRPSRRMRLR